MAHLISCTCFTVCMSQRLILSSSAVVAEFSIQFHWQGEPKALFQCEFKFTTNLNIHITIAEMCIGSTVPQRNA